MTADTPDTATSRARARVAEEWRPVPFDPRYQVSDLGHVHGTRGTLLRPFYTGRGYFRVYIGKRAFSVHSIVLAAFTGPRPEGHEGAHVNGDKFDNRWSNLIWTTPAENCAMKWEHGTMNIGEGHGQAKLTDEAVRQIRMASGNKTALGREYGVHRKTIANAMSGKRWKHVGRAVIECTLTRGEG